ncbi:MAG: hypothetical protein IPN17_01295 [Deltaproteobacteria bacterium]|nr:hypothetical protein [Deltaproteobacteria bacterium]
MEELAAPSGPITFVTERLSSSLRALTLAGRIEPLRAASLAATNAVTIGESLLEIEPSTRLKTSTAASIVDDTWLAPLPELGEDALFEEFRRFHGQVEEARRLVEGVRRGFAIEREFETRLRDRVQTALRTHHDLRNRFWFMANPGQARASPSRASRFPFGTIADIRCLSPAAHHGCPR